jgi:hypothetical protein
MKIKVVSFNECKSNTLIGFATVDFIDYGFELQGFAIHQNDKKRWIYLPAKPPSDPKQTQWIKMMNFYDSRAARRFEKQVLLELDKYLGNKDDLKFD